MEPYKIQIAMAVTLTPQKTESESIMLNITYEINGKKVNPKSFGNAIEQAILNQVTEHIKKTVGSVRCSEHHQAPKIKVKGRSLDKLSFEVSGCCEQLIEKVKQKLK
jgi:actin-like ATPase involved in cell morphogenesis